MATTFKISNGDIVTSGATGKFLLVSESDKLRQDIKEFFTVNVLPSGFGAGLDQLIGVVEVSPEIFMSLADRQIRDGLSKFIDLIRADSRIQRLASERILNVTNILVSVDPVDPTRFYYSANFITENGASVPISTVL